jgi:hypothetical protein
MITGRKEATWPAYTGDCGVKVSLRQPVAVVLVPFLVVSIMLLSRLLWLIKKAFPASAVSLSYPSLISCIQSQRCLLDTQECSQSESVFNPTLFILF